MDSIFRNNFLDIKYHGRILMLSHTIPTFNDPEREGFENIVGKGENAGNQHFLPQCFILIPKQVLTLEPNLICRLKML